MPSFTDLADRKWQLDLNVHLAQQIRSALDVDFLNAHDGKALVKLAESDELFVSTLYMLCEEQAQAISVTPEEFAKGLAGDVLEFAEQALEEMLLAFTRPAKRPALQAVLSRVHEVQTKAQDLAVQKVRGEAVTKLIQTQLEKAGREADQKLAAAFSTVSVSRTNGPAPPAASTPAP